MIDFSIVKPENETELYNWIRIFAGITLPKVTVMPNATCSPFEFVSDIYFKRYSDFLLFAGRDSGKTTDVALASWLSAKFNPNIEIGLVGAIENQARKAYAYTKKWAKRYSDCKTSYMSETRFNNNSLIQILSGTINGLNSPHPNIGILDEFELTTNEKFVEFENMLHSSKDFNAIEILTTSIKYPNGMAVKTMEESGYAFKPEGVITIDPLPKRKLCLWTTLDVAERCSLNCEACKGLTKDNQSFWDICQGRLKNTDGFIKISDIHRKFSKLPKETFESQNLVIKPELEGVVFPWLSKAIEDFPYDPEYIKQFQIVGGVDFGGYPDPCAMLLAYLKGEHIYIFSEIYTVKDSPSQFIQEIKEQTMDVRRPILYADPSGKSFWREGILAGVRFFPPITRDKEEQINYVNGIGMQGLIHIHKRCKNLINEGLNYYRNPQGVIKAPKGDHTMDILEYFIPSVSSLKGHIREV